MHDFRGQLTDEGHCVVEAVHRETGKTHQEIVRTVVHEWALGRMREASLIARLARGEGIDMDQGGRGGK